ncbi:HNH endonuclease [Pseudoalteromonas sp.]|uniref:HNH endonuclease n=1 Tax=Pseudoalteromonas sp. TaxID=53249 RepID=UPI003001C911
MFEALETSRKMMKYDTSDWSEASIRFEAQGKAPKSYGERVFRFGAAMTLSVLLPRRGWKLVKSTKNYAYLQPPEISKENIYSLKAKVPTKEQALEIARHCYAKEESWMGQLGEWPAWYTHKRRTIMNELVSSEDRRSITKKFAYELPPKSALHIGEWGVWELKVVKSDGDFEVYESGAVSRDEIPKIDDTQIIEGQELSYQLTKYERSSKARQQCIEHHGVKCKVCDLNFESLYGDIGRGFIHVHHIVPVSRQKDEYQIDPINDLIPVCPNCHSMLHRRDPPHSIEELRAILLNRF